MSGAAAQHDDEDLSVRIPRAASDPAAALEALQNKAPPQPPASDVDPKAQEKYEFSIDFKAADGSTWKGTFRNRALTPQDVLNRGLLMTSIANGVPFSIMDEETAAHFQAIAHMQISLEKAPEWWKLGAGGVTNMRLFHMVYAEVMAHEATFHGPYFDPSTGEG